MAGHLPCPSAGHCQPAAEGGLRESTFQGLRHLYPRESPADSPPHHGGMSLCTDSHPIGQSLLTLHTRPSPSSVAPEHPGATRLPSSFLLLQRPWAPVTPPNFVFGAAVLVTLLRFPHLLCTCSFCFFFFFKASSKKR